MRVVFVNRFYWPEEPATGQLLTDLAEGLAARGHDVAVITSHPGTSGLARRETRNGVEIHRVSGTRFFQRRKTLAGKAADFATFYLAALSRLLDLAERNSVVVPLTDPPLVGIGAWMIARLRGARVIHWTQDIYPELAVELAGQRWLAAITPLRDLAWRRADRCVTLGHDMVATLANAGVARESIACIPNWGPEGVAPATPHDVSALRRTWALEGKFVVAYSGNLGRVHDLDPILNVAAALRSEPHIAFLFIGGGAQRAALEATAHAQGLDNVHFRPPQPRAQLSIALSVGDLHWVTLRPGCERLVFPSKLYGIAAVGRPVLFLGPAQSELARLVRTRGIGLAFTREQTATIAAEVSDLSRAPEKRAVLGRAARSFALEHDARHATVRWDNLLGTLAA